MVRRVLVRARVARGVGQRVDHHRRRRQVRVADAEADHVHALAALLGDLPLELGEQVRRHRASSALRDEPHSEPEAPADRSELDRQISSAGPVSVASPSRSSTSRSPPARCTVTGLSHQPLATQAALAATALVPEESVSPAPRSQTPTVMSCSPSTRTSWTLVRSGKRSWFSTSGPSRSSSARSGWRADDRVRVADRDRCQLDLLAADVDRLRLADLDGAHLLLDLALAAHRCADHARADDDPHLVRAAATGEPAGGDPRAVARQLGDRAVRVPDHDLGRVAVRGDDLEDPVRADAEVVVADPLHPLGRQRDRQLGALDEQVVVAEAMPLRELHPATLPSRLTISCATSAGGRLASTGTSPGIRRIHLRW